MSRILSCGTSIREVQLVFSVLVVGGIYVVFGVNCVAGNDAEMLVGCFGYKFFVCNLK